MMTVVVLIIVGLTVLALMVGVFMWKKSRRGGGGEVDYRSFFFMGLVFLTVGISLSISTKNPGLIGISGLGVAYLAIGLANRDKWKK